MSLGQHATDRKSESTEKWTNTLWVFEIEFVDNLYLVCACVCVCVCVCVRVCACVCVRVLMPLSLTNLNSAADRLR